MINGLNQVLNIIRVAYWLVMAMVICALQGCSDDVIVGRQGPSDQQALIAMQQMISDGARLFAVPLPSGVKLATAKIWKCVPATPQVGHRCLVGLATPDIPLLGGLAADVQVRFVKQSQDQWAAYLN